MAGHMGTTRTTIQNLPLIRIDTTLNLLFVKGNVPGSDDAYIEVRDAKKKVLWEGMRNLRRGKEEGEWLDRNGTGKGVRGLPFPAGTVGMKWPEVVQMSGTKA